MKTNPRTSFPRRRALPFTVSILATLLGCAPQADLQDPATLRMNHIQVVGSHNSYKKAMLPEVMQQLRAVNPEVADSLDYEHDPLEEQLDRGLRNLELDVFWDPDGTRSSWPEGHDPTSALRVLHVQNLDDQSHCATLTSCLGQLRNWSLANPGHLPIAVTMNAKDQVIEQEGFVQPLPFDEAAWQFVDSTLRSGLGSQLIEPREVFPQEASEERNGALPTWPLLDDARGRFLFVLDEQGPKRASYAARWHERAMFTNTSPGEPGAAVLILNDPIARGPFIQQSVRDGYLVRTRADADTVEARLGTTERRDAAFASGAHWVTTDYDVPAKFGTGYAVELPGGGVARCNPALELNESACDALRGRTDN